MIISCHGADCPDWGSSLFVLNCVVGPLIISVSTPFSNTLENGVLTEMFGPKREEITEDGRTLINEGPRDVWLKYNAGDQMKENGTGGACGTWGEKRNGYRILVGKPDGKVPI